MSTGHYAEHAIPGTKANAEYWLTAFEKFKRHRDGCRVCGNSNPLNGPHCAEGRALRNSAIDETGK